MRRIVTISGGLSSAYVAWWVKNEYKDEEIIYYFNDTLWEHPDLYRFLDDIEKKFDIEILRDNDGRNPEQVFYDKRALGNNRMPICSRVLKAERLQKFVEPGDQVFFGIGAHEKHRAVRIDIIYSSMDVCTRFPLIEYEVTQEQIKQLFIDNNIEIPELYKMGFEHNNCSGGCVRSGKRQWVHLYKTSPDVYMERMRVEKEVSEFLGKPYTYMKTMSLERLKEILDNQLDLPFGDEDDYINTECVGICATEN